MTKASPKVALYNNLNSPGMDTTVNNLGPSPTPPDSTGAIGPNNYVEMVNSEIAVRNRSLALVSQVGLGSLINDPFNTNYCDPQIQWDQTAGRWLYVFLYCNTQDPSLQYFIFAWSKTASPTPLVTGWCPFGVNTSPYLFDYPKLGHNSKYMIIGGNMYDTNGPPMNPPFVSARIVWIPLPAKGVTTCPASLNFRYTSAFPLMNGDGVTPAFTPVPVNTTTSSGNGYVVSAYDPAIGGGPQTKLSVWHVDSSNTLHQHADVTVDSFTFPAPAPQLGTTHTIDTLDGRLTQAVGDPTTGIWTQHTIDGPGGRSMVRWYEIEVAGPTASLANQGNVASATDFVFNGAISPRTDAAGAAVIYNRSSASIDPLIAAQMRFTATPAGNMEPGELVLRTSPAADTDGSCNGSPCRWGDYSGLTPDPVVKNVVWGTSEVNTASTGLGAPAWADQNFALSFVTKPLAPTAVVAAAGNGSATVSWTPNTYVPTSPVTSYTITAYVGPTATFTLVVAAPATTAYFTGLINGTAYTFTVFATNSVGNSDESLHSNAVTPGRPTSQAPPTPEPGRTPVPQSSPPLPSPR